MRTYVVESLAWYLAADSKLEEAFVTMLQEHGVNEHSRWSKVPEPLPSLYCMPTTLISISCLYAVQMKDLLEKDPRCQAIRSRRRREDLFYRTVDAIREQKQRSAFPSGRRAHTLSCNDVTVW